MVVVTHKIKLGKIHVPKGDETAAKRDKALTATLTEQVRGRELESITISRSAVAFHFKGSRIIFEYDENNVVFGNFGVSSRGRPQSNFAVSYGDLPKEIREQFSSGTVHGELPDTGDHIIELSFHVRDGRFALAGVEGLAFHRKGHYYQDHNSMGVTVPAKNTIDPHGVIEDYKVASLIGSSGLPVRITLQIGDNVKTYVLQD